MAYPGGARQSTAAGLSRRETPYVCKNRTPGLLANGFCLLQTLRATAGNVVRYEHTLLDRAKRFTESGDFLTSPCIVANTACEIAAEHALHRVCSRRGYSAARTKSILSGFLSFNLASERLRVLYNALSGDLIEGQTFWETFAPAVKQLRHTAVHDAVRPTKEQAEKFHSDATQLIEYLFDLLNPGLDRP